MPRDRKIQVIAIMFAISIAGQAAIAQEYGKGDDPHYTYEGLLALGHGKYIAQNFEGAIAQYEKAKKTEPGRAEAYYFIGAAMAKQGRASEAVTVLKSAATVAGEGAPDLTAKSLFLVAMILEGSRDLSGAKYAWAQYKEFAVAHPTAHVFVEVANQRVVAIEAFEKKVTDYQIVKDRIASQKE